MNKTHQDKSTGFLRQLGWWIFFLISAFYGAYALYMGVLEILSQLGIIQDAPHRAVPIIFILHALSGGLALISGALQFNRNILSSKRSIHRLLGRIYVGTIWISSTGGLWSAIFFEVGTAAKFVFGALAILWFITTTIAFLRARERRIKEHREWMIRSFALSLFFVSFSFWVPGLENTNLPGAVAYPLSVFLSWSLNLLVAETWIRVTRHSLSVRRLTTLANGRI